MSRVIYEYHEYDGEVTWKPHTVARIKPKDILIGIECELECGGEDEDNAIRITSAMGFPCDESDDIVCSHDGSLDDGIEFITHPATYDYHTNKDGKGYNWEQGLSTASGLGYLGEGKHDSEGGCIRGGHAGIHYNVSRQSLGGGKENVEYNLMMLLINNKDWLMEKFSRRKGTSNGFHYCCYNSDEPKILPKQVRDEYSSITAKLARMVENARDHYSAINFGKRQVVEFRFMTSTTYYKWFKAGLQLIMMLCWCAREMTLEETAAVRFPFFLQMAKANGYTEFVEYCRYHRIDIHPLVFAQ